MQLKRILSLSPGPQLIGYAYFEGNRLIECGIKNNADGPVEWRIFEKGLKIIDDLTNLFRPEILILPALEDNRRRINRERFIKAVRTILGDHYLILTFCSSVEVKRCFSRMLDERPTIRNMAAALGEMFPQIKCLIPRRRQTYDSQDYWTLMFDAIARWLAWNQRKK
jgi:hypothetical protein